MNALIVEDSGYAYTWFQNNFSGICDVISAHGNTLVLPTVDAAVLQGYTYIVVLLDLVADNKRLGALWDAVVSSVPVSVTVVTYPCFEWALLTSSFGRRMFRDQLVADAYIENCADFRKSKLLTDIMCRIYGDSHTKSSEKLAKLLLTNHLAACARTNSKYTGMYWTVDCGCLNFSNPCYPDTLRAKNKSILDRINIHFDSPAISQSMIDNYGSYELALQHLKEMGMI